MLAHRQLRPAQLSSQGATRSIRCVASRVSGPARRPGLTVRVLAAAGTKSSKPTPSSAKAAVEAGLQEFQQSKDYKEAVRLFKAALDLQPSSEEAAAALFNLGCAYAKLRDFKGAAEAIGTAINQHNLKLTVALQVSSTAGRAGSAQGSGWVRLWCTCGVRLVPARPTACVLSQLLTSLCI